MDFRPSRAARLPGSHLINPAAKPERLGPVLRNDHGRRIDKQLDVDIHAPEFQALRKSNRCNWYYLRGECSGCERRHDLEPLTDQEYDWLWFSARQALCYKVKGSRDCDDAKCIYGHRRS